MKKFTYLLAVAAVFTACNSGNNGYTVTGTVEGAADGDTVYLETVEGRQFVKLDSAVIKDGTFTFKGTQDTAVNRYISYKYNPQIEMFARFKMKSSFHKTKRII